MDKIAYIRISGKHVLCSTYVGGRIESSLGLPERDLWDFPNMLRSLYESNYKVRFSDPP